MDYIACMDCIVPHLRCDMQAGHPGEHEATAVTRERFAWRDEGVSTLRHLGFVADSGRLIPGLTEKQVRENSRMVYTAPGDGFVSFDDWKRSQRTEEP